MCYCNAFGTQQTTKLQHTSPSELRKKQRPTGVGGTAEILQYVMIWVMYFPGNSTKNWLYTTTRFVVKVCGQ